MNKRMMLLGLTAVLLLLLAACAPGGATAVPQAAQGADAAPAAEGQDGDAMSDDAMSDEMGDGDMADGEMSDGEMSDDAMSDGEMSEDAMSDGDMGEDMDAEEMDGAAHDDGAAMDGEEMDGESMEGGMDEMSDRPAWQNVALTDATTGEAFTLGGFAGRTVFVEPMATWCSNCRQQLNNVAQARQGAGADVVFVALSLETTLDPADLARYQQDNGFDWTFAVMSEELLQGLADEFGRSITSAPSTPHFIIRPDGSFTELSTGIDSADELLAMLAAAGS